MVQVARCAAIALGCAVLTGCGSSGKSPFERFERLPTVEDLSTVDLGEYVVPIPVYPGDGAGPTAATQVQIEFELYAAVLPEYERTLTSNFERLQGRFRNKVIEVCRNTAMEDLLDPTLTTLKARLADELKPFIGDSHIERIHIADPQVKRL
ncbi:hypothetical protein Pan181_04720 [Aeoliella mucimassa]|uniref:Flagellar protein FliL n=2 Tax=Aeoliella mucimassa TaxID=2527972 RepID=A0A518AHT0_9BACT|nr:hypothetical protein Pan181_04720 [Aeoliella mucimassa]